MKGNRLNIVVYISHDTGRFISPYGIRSVFTPNADRVAAEGAVMEQAFCTAPQCSPSRASVFTGRYPHSTGVLGLTDKWAGWSMNESEIHLARHLHDAGYETALFGFAHEIMSLDGDMERVTRRGFDYNKFEVFYSSSKIYEDLNEFLFNREEPEKPFYTQIAVFETHRHYDFNNCQPDDTLGVTVPPFLNDSPGTRSDFAELQGSVRRWDEGLGAILDILDRWNLTENTLLVVTTDHGLAVPRAKCTLYDPGIETMLILRCPKYIHPTSRFKELISNVDITPTILEASGVTLSSHIEGRSFWPLVTGCGDYKKNEAVFAEKTHHTYYDPKRCIRTERFKYIRNFEATSPEDTCIELIGRPIYTDNLDKLRVFPQDPEELYDLQADPQEQHNLSDDADFIEVKKEMIRKLGHWMKQTNDPILHGPIATPQFYTKLKEFTSGAEK